MERVCRRFGVLTVMMVLTSPCLPCSSGAEIDRLLAAVNGRVITEWDIRMAGTLNALLQFGGDSNAGPLSDELSRLIDLELVRQELESFPLTSGDEEEIRTRMDELKLGYAEIGGLAMLLRRLGLQEEELENYVRLQAVTMRFISLRFRPFVRVSEGEVKSYYERELLPRLHREGTEIPSLGEVSKQIEEILVEERVNAAMDRWIRNVRRHSKIEFFINSDVTGGEIRE